MMDQMYGLKMNDHQLFFPQALEQNLITAPPWIGMQIIFQTKDIFQELRTMEQDVYWKQDWDLRVLHWLPSNFYLNASL